MNAPWRSPDGTERVGHPWRLRNRDGLCCRRRLDSREGDDHRTEIWSRNGNSDSASGDDDDGDAAEMAGRQSRDGPRHFGFGEGDQTREDDGKRSERRWTGFGRRRVTQWEEQQWTSRWAGN